MVSVACVVIGWVDNADSQLPPEVVFVNTWKATLLPVLDVTETMATHVDPRAGVLHCARV
jgi:hypothetical protein